MLEFGHGEDPVAGVKHGERPKKGNMKHLLASIDMLEKSGEADHVKLLCGQHNRLADDTTRGKGARKWQAIIEAGPLEELEQRLEEKGVKPLARFMGLKKLGTPCQATACPIRVRD